MSDRLKPLLLPALLVLLAVFGGTGAALYLDDGNPDTPPVRVLKAEEPQEPDPIVTLEGEGAQPDLSLSVDPDNQLTPDDVDEASTDHTLGLHEDSRDETPPGIPGSVLDKGAERADELAEDLPPPVAPAGAQLHSCPSRPVVNQSSLSGPRLGTALHFTVSSPGSINVIRGLFNTPSFGASSNYGIELSGECQQWVGESRKAWAQGAFNSNYVSIEIVTNDLSRAQWLATPLLQRGILASLVRDINARIGAPNRLVDPSGCTPLAGIVDHDRLECGNSHWDVGPGFPWDVFIKQVQQGVKGSALTKAELRIVRRTSKGTRRSKARACRQNVAQRASLRRASRRNPAADRKRRRGARRKLLHTNYRRHCVR